ncbi:MAG: class II aldolase/adducin family protein [Acidimicrobiales bacterium]
MRPSDHAVAAARAQVQHTCLRLVGHGLVVGSAGNVSIRVGDDHAVVSAGGVVYEELTPDDHPLVELAGGTVVDGRRAPTSELPLHTGLLRSRSEIGAIVHTHSKWAAAFAVARLDLPFVMNESMGTRAERVLVTRYAPPGSPEMGDAAAAAFARQPGSRAVLLANHGVVAWAETAAAAWLVAAQVEWIAEVTAVARLLGGEHALERRWQDAIGTNYGVTIAREEPS